MSSTTHIARLELIPIQRFEASQRPERSEPRAPRGVGAGAWRGEASQGVGALHLVELVNASDRDSARLGNPPIRACVPCRPCVVQKPEVETHCLRLALTASTDLL